MAKAKWVCEAVTRERHRVSDREFQQILAEISECLYRSPASLKDCPNSTGSSHDRKTESSERTGTDG